MPSGEGYTEISATNSLLSDNESLARVVLRFLPSSLRRPRLSVGPTTQVADRTAGGFATAVQCHLQPVARSSWGGHLDAWPLA